MDRATVLGIGVALGGITTGQLLEGGRITQLLQPTAAIIILSGTAGATLVQTPMSTFVRAMKSIKNAFAEPANKSAALIEEIVQYATIARKEGILALEPLAPKASDPFLQRAINMAVDGVDSAAMRESLEAVVAHAEEEGEDVAKVFEAAGGYSPTIGIIGAILGLIQVMSHLSEVAKVGEGIAVAFVATIYGLLVANVICLPLGGKLKTRTRDNVAMKTLMLEGVLAIQEGMNPKLVRERLLARAPEAAHAGKKKAEGAGEAEGEAPAQAA